jgi:hypothetical protein
MWLRISDIGTMPATRRIIVFTITHFVVSIAKHVPAECIWPSVKTFIHSGYKKKHICCYVFFHLLLAYIVWARTVKHIIRTLIAECFYLYNEQHLFIIITQLRMITTLMAERLFSISSEHFCKKIFGWSLLQR